MHLYKYKQYWDSILELHWNIQRSLRNYVHWNDNCLSFIQKYCSCGQGMTHLLLSGLKSLIYITLNVKSKKSGSNHQIWVSFLMGLFSPFLELQDSHTAHTYLKQFKFWYKFKELILKQFVLITTYPTDEITDYFYTAYIQHPATKV